MKPTYQQQFNKLTEAYIEGKVNPYNSCACFVGNLLNNQCDWIIGRGYYKFSPVPSIPLSRDTREIAKALTCIKKESDSLYTLEEVYELENMFMYTIGANTEVGRGYRFSSYRPTSQDEEALFKAFEVTLDLLKEIHISKGEVIDEVPVFKKRELIAQ